MCGILFSYSKSKPIDINKFTRALELQKHRGPDSTNVKALTNNILFGHVRLSIIDLTKNSDQPIINESTSNILIFNGEIYNFIELKEKMSKEGISFNSKGDGEVLLKSIEKYGIDSINDFNGMWAFVFYDSKKNELVISRDRFGKKPLYYYQDENYFIVSSEIKSIFSLIEKDRILNKEFLNVFLTFGYWPNDSEETFYKNIKQIMPGVTARVNLNYEQLKINRIQSNTIRNFLNYKSELSIEEIIYDSVKLRLRSDVKNALFLSGGIDSSVIASYANELNKNITWITGDTKSGNDLEYARNLAKQLKIDLHEIPITYDFDLIKRIEDMINIYEIPIPITGHSIAMNVLFQKISEMDIRVVLEGSGGDEIYGGYFDYYSKHLINSYIEKKNFHELILFVFHSIRNNQLAFKTLFKDIIQKLGNSLFNLSFKKEFYNYLKLRNHSIYPPKEDMLFSSLDKFQIYDSEFGDLQTWLRMNDCNSMMYSVELRSPLLDFRQIQYMSLEEKNKFRNGYNKYLLRNALPKNIDDKIKWRKDKQGFRWMQSNFINENSQYIKSQINNSDLLNTLVDSNYINNIFDNTKNKFEANFIARCFSISVLEKMYNCKI